MNEPVISGAGLAASTSLSAPEGRRSPTVSEHAPRASGGSVPGSRPVVAVPTLLVPVALVVPPVLSRPIADISWVQPMILAIVVLLCEHLLVGHWPKPRGPDRT